MTAPKKWFDQHLIQHLGQKNFHVNRECGRDNCAEETKDKLSGKSRKILLVQLFIFQCFCVLNDIKFTSFGEHLLTYTKFEW